MKLTKKCLVCSDIYSKSIRQSKKGWKKRKFCSRKCCDISKVGKKLTEKHKNKLRKSCATRIANGEKIGFKKGHTPWHKGLKGIHFSPKTEFKKGHIPPMKGKKNFKVAGEKNHMWKGDNVSYSGFHLWLLYNHTKKNICNFCNQSKKTDWALKKDKKYSRNINDYFELCRSCHLKYDFNNNRSKLNRSQRTYRRLSALRAGVCIRASDNQSENLLRRISAKEL